MYPPKMKIFRDGRVLMIDEKGARQSKIDAGRVADLERDLARMPLLQATRWIEFAQRKPMLHAGGVSYIRFGEDIIVATPGIPIDSDWKAAIDRINADRPATSTPFRPQQLLFYDFDSPAEDGNPIATGDPALIASIIDTYDPAYTALRHFGIVAAPGWMDPPAIGGCMEELWRASPKHGRGAGVQDGNLIEYGTGGFGDGGHGPPMLYPPEVKIYSDGRIVFATKEAYWQGTVDPKRLARLKSDLAKNDLLRESQLLRVTNGGLISMHGGMAYIRYRDADDEVVVTALSHPHRGPYVRLLNRIREEIPDTYSRFRPKEITFHLYRGNAWATPVDWPFTIALDESTTMTDPAAIAFIFDHAFGGFSWMQANVRVKGVDYEIILRSALGWYEPDILAVTLYDLRLESQ